jgi:hypothetical protein
MTECIRSSTDRTVARALVGDHGRWGVASQVEPPRGCTLRIRFRTVDLQTALMVGNDLLDASVVSEFTLQRNSRGLRLAITRRLRVRGEDRQVFRRIACPVAADRFRLGQRDASEQTSLRCSR